MNLSVHFNKKMGTGFFGGEGFIMQRLSGSGMAFAEVDGELVEYTLGPGQQMVVDTGNVLGFEGGVSIDIQQVKGLKNKLLGARAFSTPCSPARARSGCKPCPSPAWPAP